MCKIYLAHINDADWINTESDNLVEKCKKLAPYSSYCEYQSFSFIDGTGYVETVYDEIELILQSNKDHCYIQDVDEFIRQWEINKYSDYKLSELSGGWKKYLSLALFTNLKSEGKIYFDSFRQLSDRLINLLLKNMLTTGVSAVFLFEYDVSLFPTNITKKNLFLKNLESDFTDKRIKDDKIGLAVNETNYDAEN
jgi:hypothetical protein